MSNRPPLGPNARSTVPVLGAIAIMKALAIVIFAAVLGTAAALLGRFTYAHFFAEASYSSDYERQQAEFAGYGQAQISGIWDGAQQLTEPGVLLALGACAVLLKTAADWAASSYTARAAVGAKAHIRAQLLERVLATGGKDTPDGAAATGVLLARGLNALDNYYTKTLTALVSTAVIPALIWVVILAFDWVSALIVALTVPLIPLFMVLIGKTTREDTAQAQADLHRLSNHILELAKGLPALIGLGRAGAQRQALAQLGLRYRQRTMHTLRSAFLSSLALELITTISVAIVAVFIGVRLVNGEMGLDIALMVLLLAPECYQPLRDVGTAYHQSEEGVAALRSAQAIIERPLPAPVQPSDDLAENLVVKNLEVAYPGRRIPLGPISFTASRGSATAITGPSGCGKSTVLNAIAGLIADGLTPTGAETAMRVSGTIEGAGHIVWIPQSPRFLAATALGEVALYGGAEAHQVLEDAQTDLSAFNTYLEAVGLGSYAQLAPESLSMGQQRRLAVARALARLATYAEAPITVLVDEPTAHLDPAAAESIDRALLHLRRPNVTLIIVTHDRSLARQAEQTVSYLPQTQTWETSSQYQLSIDQSCGTGENTFFATKHHTEPRSEVTAQGHQSLDKTPNILETLTAFFALAQPARGYLVLAVLLSVLTATFGIALTSLSGWLIVRAAEQPAMMYLTLAVVGVRFFGIGRATWRYCERLVTHRLVLDAATTVRSKTWVALSSVALSVRALLRGDKILDRLISDADELRDLAPRVLLPAITQALVMALAIGTTALIAPQATGAIAVAALLSTLAVPWLVSRADNNAESAERESTAGVLRLGLSSIMAASDLQANGLSSATCGALARIDRQASQQAARGAFASGLGQGINTALWWSAALVTIGLVWEPVRSGQLRAPMVAIIILMSTAMLEVSNQHAEATRGWKGFARIVARLCATGARTAEIEPQTSKQTKKLAQEAPIRLDIKDASARWQGMERPVFSGMNATVASGQWLGITGPSGAGKTTALATLLGFLPLEHGQIRVNNLPADAASLLGYAAWCPQEAHIFESTVAGNLALARDREHAPSEAEMQRALERVGLGEFYAQLPHGLLTPVGSGGSYLSGGQRQRLAIARTLLVDSPLLLLDEPTAHLDAPSARLMMDEVSSGTRQGDDAPAVVVVSHRAEDIARCDAVVEL